MKCLIPKRSVPEIVLRHAAGFAAFAPASLTYFCGIPEQQARSQCVLLAKIGKLNQEMREGELWYRAVE